VSAALETTRPAVAGVHVYDAVQIEGRAGIKMSTLLSTTDRRVLAAAGWKLLTSNGHHAVWQPPGPVQQAKLPLRRGRVEYGAVVGTIQVPTDDVIRLYAGAAMARRIPRTGTLPGGWTYRLSGIAFDIEHANTTWTAAVWFNPDTDEIDHIDYAEWQPDIGVRQ
jgi:hypothetical protein